MNVTVSLVWLFVFPTPLEKLLKTAMRATVEVIAEVH